MPLFHHNKWFNCYSSLNNIRTYWVITRIKSFGITICWSQNYATLAETFPLPKNAAVATTTSALIVNCSTAFRHLACFKPLQCLLYIPLPRLSSLAPLVATCHSPPPPPLLTRPFLVVVVEANFQCTFALRVTRKEQKAKGAGCHVMEGGGGWTGKQDY